MKRTYVAMQDDEDDDSDQVVPPPAKRAKMNESDLPHCRYGMTCSRKNPQHFGEYSHPVGFKFPTVVRNNKNFAHFVDNIYHDQEEEGEGEQEEEQHDNDKVEPLNTKKEEDSPPPTASSSSSSLPPCKYGVNCIRKNPAHFLQFSHPQAVPLAAAAPAVKKGPKIVDDDDDNDDDIRPVAPKKKASAPAPPPAANVSLQGVTVAITGTLSTTRNIIVQQIQNAGGIFHATVTKNTQFLVADNPNAGTAKLVKAQQMGVKVVGEDWLQERFDAAAKSAAAEAGQEAEDDGAAADNTPRPKTKMADGEAIPIQGGHGNYEVRYRGGVYYCTCTAWKMQNLPVDVRTCKHLRDVLGDEFETYRCGRSDNRPAKVEKVGAPALLLANKWEETHDPTGWWISEKLDGVRAYWDGKRFLSRQGNVFYAPDWFVADLPADKTLDGELFGGRKQFQSTVSIVKSQDLGDRWKKLVYKVFDIPSEGAKPFEQRMDSLKALFAGKPKYVELVEQTACKGKNHVTAELKRVESLGGEGLMLRQPGSKYVGSRSSTLLKVKGFEDTEALVVGYEAGQGKYAGMVGSLKCQLANGKTFSVGSGLSDADRAKPPKVGTVITVRYQELTDGGIPRFPTYVGVRIDVAWPPAPK